MNNGSEKIMERVPDGIVQVCPICGTPDLDHTSDLDVIRHDVAVMRQEFAQIMELLTAIKDQVSPALEALENSPIGKMFLGGK